jgi:hypothetical protein
VTSARMVTLFLASVLTACSTKPTPRPSPGPASSALPVGIVATVGSLAVAEEAIVSVANAQQIPPRQAADGEVRDALFAAAAIQRGYEDAPEVRTALRGRLARARLEMLRQEAAAGPVTDAEVREATARHFVDLDRPPAFRVVHAVVMVPQKATTVERAKAKSVAERIAERVASISSADEFKERAESIDHEGFEVRVETLKPVAADGRIVDVEHPAAEEHSLLPSFARAAARLTEPGQKSGIVLTDYGFHIIMLLERTAPYVVALEDRRQMLHDEIITDRAKRMKKELLDQLRSISAPMVERAADAIVATVVVDEHETP